MTKIEFRFRPYKDKSKRGTYMIVNGKQTKKISYRQLSRSEIAHYRKAMLLNEKGYLQKDKKTFRKQKAEDHIKEVKLGDLNDVVVDINKDPQTGAWERESRKDYDYVDPEDIDTFEAVIDPKPKQAPTTQTQQQSQSTSTQNPIP